MRVQITHLKAPWPEGAVVGSVLDLPEVPAWAAGKCKQVGDDVELTIRVMLTEEGGDTVTDGGPGEALPPVDAVEAEGEGESALVIEETPAKAKKK